MKNGVFLYTDITKIIQGYDEQLINKFEKLDE